MFRISWGIALVFSLATLVGILVVTRDLSTTDAVFKDGVNQALKVDTTSASAVEATKHLPSADKAIDQSFPQVVGVLGSLSSAQNTLGTLADQLTTLGSALASADAPLAGIIGSTQQASASASAAARPAASIVGILSRANQKVLRLGPLLDQTNARAANIESKLRILLLLPAL
ncbi:MAG TPA: hypothetical protein VLJ59_01220 [Mycobacteriales bacterium]|nr:hypothetical protein [Mycobacteriales bacterium]